MDKKLIYSAEQYKERLSAYAKDTIPYESYNRFLKININKHGNPAVVEELTDHFKIYISEKPEVRLWVRTPTSFGDSWMGNFYAEVYITQNDLSIKLKPSKFQFVSALFVIGIFIIGPICFTGKLPEASIFFACFGIAALVIQYSAGKVKYRNFILNFLNKIGQ